jgi:hypothetical protein
MYNFIDSNLLQTITILVVGVFVFIIYKANIREERKRAATILIMEIRGIEKALEKLREVLRIDVYSSIPIIKENSWEKFKFLFIQYLDQDEYSLISEFYSIACRIEEERSILIRQIIMSFETKCRAMHESFVDVAEHKPELKPQEFLDETVKIAEKVVLNTPPYQSLTPIKLIEKLIKNIKYIATSSAGSKIKKFARII